MNHKISGIIGQIISLLQITSFFIFVRYYIYNSNVNRELRFPIFLASLGIITIILAVSLRFSFILMYQPVQRYAPMTVMFSIAVFLLAVSVLRQNVQLPILTIGIIIVILNFGYLIGEVNAMVWNSHNLAKRFINARLEMPIYALAKGNERDLGPPTIDKGLLWRSNLHAFLEKRKLSVFGNIAYLSMGTKITLPINSNSIKCNYISHTVLNNRDLKYQYLNFKGINNDGFLFTLDDQQRIDYFNFVVKLTPIADVSYTLFPTDLINKQIYFAKIKNNKILETTICKK